jgi:hypothetical protein
MRTQPRKKLPRQLARTLLGVSLVVVSVAVVGFITNDRSDTQVVVAAKNALVLGQLMSSDDVVEIRVPTTAPFDLYLKSADLVADSYLGRSLEPSELIPRSALVSKKPHDDAVVTLELRIGSPAWLRSGVVAELWVSPHGPNNSFSPPFVVSPEVVVVAVSREDGFAADQTTSRVDVLVPRRHLPEVLHALANKHAIHLTGVGGLVR